MIKVPRFEKCRKGIKLLQKGNFKLFIQTFLNRVKITLSRLDLNLKRLWVREFHRVYCYSNVWQKTYWLGIPLLQCPLDMWTLQEIIYEKKPDFIIETGTCNGGSAYFLAHIFELIGHGKIITIDIEDREIPSHPRIIRIVGNSLSTEILDKIKSIIGDGKTMVFLDSLHNTEHVFKEMKCYSPLVSKDHYLIVADSDVNGHPIYPGYHEGDRYGGPMEAIQEFIKNNDEFIIDREREKFFMTFFPSGFLQRIKDGKEKSHLTE